MVLAAEFNDLFPATGSAQNEMRVTRCCFGHNATAPNRQSDRSLLANAKFAAFADPKFIS